MKLRIMLADDHQMFRDALCSLLHSSPELQVVAQTGDGLQVLSLARACAPHIVCLDIGMPGMNGVEVARALRAAMPQVKVIALSAFTDQRYVLDMLGAGACGYVTKAEASDELLRAIDAVRRGRTYLCPDVAGAVTHALLHNGEAGPVPSALGARERQVLQLVAEGYTSKQIGHKLHVASSTVDVHRRNIMRKLGLHGVAELTRYVVANERPD
ncbi:response regulator [Rhodoferax sp.]|uniref:response regulator n=1 Tax=Rhodoferax sp. TaxID=50421 RepID=UPI00277833DA|nr:response regulator transcription factor [Rhodoferax sp.]